MDESPDTFIFASDFSGSTRGVGYYHENAKKHLEGFKNRIKDVNDKSCVHYLVWDTECKEVRLKDITRIYASFDGRGGTEPVTVCQWIKSNLQNEKSVELWLITDGEIGQESIGECLKYNRTINYSKVKFIIINEYRINMSVGCSFFTKTLLEVYNNTDCIKRINTQVDINFDEINATNFNDKIVFLQDYIQAKFMVEDEIHCIAMSERLSKLRSRILKEIRSSCKSDNTAVELGQVTSKKQFLNAFRESIFYKSVTNAEIKDLNYIVDSKISTLINYLMNSKFYEFRSLFDDEHGTNRKIDFEQFSKQEEEEIDLDPDTLPDADQVSFIDVVSWQESSKPVLLLVTCDLINELWIKKNRSIYKNTLSCPLFLLLNKDFKKMIGHVFDVSTFVNLKKYNVTESDLIKDPASGVELFGGILPFREADRWNDYVLARTFFRGKVQSLSYGLMYYVIYEFARQTEWVEKDIVETLRVYAFERIKDAECFLGFTNLPLDPKEMVPVPIACFYCAEISSIVFSQTELFPLEKLKLFCSVAPYLIDICEHFNLDINKKYVLNRSKMLSLVSKLKHHPKVEDKVYFLLDRVFEKNKQFFIPKLKPNYDLDGFKCIDFTPHEILPDNLNAVSLNDLTKYLFFSYEVEGFEGMRICKNTFRPYYMIDDNNFYYHFKKLLSLVSIKDNNVVFEKFNDSDKPDPTKYISGCKFYLEFVHKYRRHPTFEEFEEMVLNRRKIYDGKVRIFSKRIVQDLETLHSLYQAFNDVDIETFVKNSCQSVPLERRMTMEKD